MTPNVIIQVLAEKSKECSQNISNSVKRNQQLYLETEQYFSMLTNASYIVTQDYIAEKLGKIVRELQIVSDMPEHFESVFEDIKRQEITYLVNEAKSGNPTPRADGKAIVVEILNDIKVTKE